MLVTSGSDNMIDVFIYILKLKGNNYYCGITKDIKERLKQHAEGNSNYTSKHLPAQLVWSTKRNGYKEARKLEKTIKNTGVKKYYNKIKWQKFNSEQ